MLVLCGQFLEEFELMVDRWTDWATEVVEAWPDDVSQATPDLDVLRARAARRQSRRPRGAAS